PTAFGTAASPHFAFAPCGLQRGGRRSPTASLTHMPAAISVKLTLATTARPAAVWAALEAAPRWREVLTDLTSARIEPDGVLRAGAVMRSFAKPDSEAADMAYRVVEARRPRHLAIEAGVGNYRSRAVYAIEKSEDGAQVTLTAEIVPTRGIDRLVV